MITLITITGNVLEKTYMGKEFLAVSVRWQGEETWAWADGEGVVRVFDRVAGHPSTCHPMSDAQREKVRQLLREVALDAKMHDDCDNRGGACASCRRGS